MQIVFAGPSGLFREGIWRILREFGEATDVGCVDDLALAFEENADAAVILLDGDCGFDVPEILLAARNRAPSTPIVVLLTNAALPTVEKLLAAGANGCVDKSASSEMLLGALRLVLVRRRGARGAGRPR